MESQSVLHLFVFLFFGGSFRCGWWPEDLCVNDTANAKTIIYSLAVSGLGFGLFAEEFPQFLQQKLFVHVVISVSCGDCGIAGIAIVGGDDGGTAVHLVKAML